MVANNSNEGNLVIIAALRNPVGADAGNETVIEAPVKQDTLTARYTAEAVNFIKANKGKPFFVYIPHTAVHVPGTCVPTVLPSPSVR